LSTIRSDKPAAAGSAEGPYAVLKNRDFLLYLIGRFIASFGQQMLAVAVGWEIYDRTHSYLNLGYVGLAQVIPMFLFTLPAGHTADNYDRKKILLWTQVIFAAACAGLGLISALQAPVFWSYLCLFVMGTARTYLWPASASFMPQLVQRSQFAKAVTWNSGSFQISAVAGPAAGGAMIALAKSAVPG
jgi:MFS family permease